MEIIGNSKFNVENFCKVNWDKVNNLFATDREGEWVDEDAGWVQMLVTICVPY